MSALEELQKCPRDLRLIDGHDIAELAIAALGCVVAFQALRLEIAGLVAGFWCLCVVIIRSDLKHFIIPNWATAGIAVLGLAYAVFSTPGAITHLSAILAALGGPIERAVLTLLGVAGFSWAFARIIGRECLGFGDVKLSGALAIWLGPYDLLLTLEVACLAALGLVAIRALRDRRTFNDGVIPFGAFLAPAAWLVFMSYSLSAMLGPWHALFG